MKKTLIDVIFASEKRKNVILELIDGPLEMPLLLEKLNTSRQALLPQMKILKGHDLVYQFDDTYALTSSGKLIAEEMKPFVDIIETLDESSHYLTKHDINGIPDALLNRINEIKGCTIVEPEIVNVHDINKDYVKEALKSETVYLLFTFMHPECPCILKKMAEKGMDISIILTRKLAEKMQRDFPEEHKLFTSYSNIKFYLYDKNLSVSSLAVTDSGFLLRLLFKNREFSNKQVMCMHEQGRLWAKELYEYFLKDSVPMK
ncbi:MAG: winged helix-turn-helix domain-containing protein [Methanolobus sp.]